MASENVQTKASETEPTTAPESPQTRAPESLQTRAPETLPTQAPETVQTRAPEAVPTKAPETVKIGVQTFTDGNFDQTVSNGVVLVDFWAEWCGPCRRLAPTVEDVAAFYDGKVVVGKLNVDENPNTAFKFSIRGIPTLLLFKGGQVVEQMVGLADKDALKKVIDKHVS